MREIGGGARKNSFTVRALKLCSLMLFPATLLLMEHFILMTAWFCYHRARPEAAEKLTEAKSFLFL